MPRWEIAGRARPPVVSRWRGRSHVPVDNPDLPGTCRVCNRSLTGANDRHLKEPPPVDPAVTAEYARRLGEREEDE